MSFHYYYPESDTSLEKLVEGDGPFFNAFYFECTNNGARYVVGIEGFTNITVFDLAKDQIVRSYIPTLPPTSAEVLLVKGITYNRRHILLSGSDADNGNWLAWSDPATGSLVRFVTTGPTQELTAITYMDKHIFYVEADGASIGMLDTSGNVLNSVSPGTTDYRGITNDGRYLYLTRRGTDNSFIEKRDPKTFTLVYSRNVNETNLLSHGLAFSRRLLMYQSTETEPQPPAGPG